MQNLLRFIQRYSNFLLFLGLEVAAFLLYISTQPYQQSKVFSSSSYVIASLNECSSRVTGYFALSQVNEDLIVENTQLRTELMQLRSLVEPMMENDSTYYYSHLQWSFVPAKVVDMQTASNHNYIVVNKGERDGIEEGQGVLSQNGVVGLVSKVNSHFSLVVPMIHPKMNLSCRIRKNAQQGFLHWQGPSCLYAYLDDIGRHVEVSEGDTVVTSGLTGRFPEDILVGVIDQVKIEDGDANYRIRVRLSTDYRSLEYVQIIDNTNLIEQEQLIPQEE